MRVCLRVIYEHLHLLWGGIISAGRVGVSLSACVLPWLQTCVYQAPRHPPQRNKHPIDMHSLITLTFQ